MCCSALARSARRCLVAELRLTHTDGYDVKLSGDAASGAKVEDDGKGHIVISFDSSVDKKRLDVAITPK